MLPDKSETNFTYSIAPDNNQFHGFKTSIKDALGNQKDQYKDLRGRNRTTADHGPEGVIWTNFDLSLIHI